LNHESEKALTTNENAALGMIHLILL